jgi:hypothetical protein
LIVAARCDVGRAGVVDAHERGRGPLDRRRAIAEGIAVPFGRTGHAEARAARGNVIPHHLCELADASTRPSLAAIGAVRSAQRVLADGIAEPQHRRRLAARARLGEHARERVGAVLRLPAAEARTTQGHQRDRIAIRRGGEAVAPRSAVGDARREREREPGHGGVLHRSVPGPDASTSSMPIAWATSKMRSSR